MTEPNPCLTRQVPRRELLQGAKLAIGGLPLFRMLQSEAEAGTGSSPKSVVMVFLEGGPSHIDTWDMKPDRPKAAFDWARPLENQ